MFTFIFNVTILHISLFPEVLFKRPNEVANKLLVKHNVVPNSEWCCTLFQILLHFYTQCTKHDLKNIHKVGS